MASYTVMARPEDATREDAVFVRDGFNVWAAIFGPFWALANRMWIVAIVLGCISFLTGLLPPFVAVIANVGLFLTAGIFAGDLKLWSLRRRGFEEQTHLTAATSEEAELRYYTDLEPPLPPKPSEPTAQLRPAIAATDPLGLFGTGG